MSLAEDAGVAGHADCDALADLVYYERIWVPRRNLFCKQALVAGPGNWLRMVPVPLRLVGSGLVVGKPLAGAITKSAGTMRRGGLKTDAINCLTILDTLEAAGNGPELRDSVP